MQLFNDYMDHGKDFAQVEAIFKSRLEESQKTTVKYGFRNDQWLKKHHGEKKAEKIMARKKSLGLKLVSTIALLPTTFPALASQGFHVRFAHHSCQGRWRTPEFPGEDEFLYFVLVEFNIEDIKELKRITQLELTGSFGC